MPIMDDPAFPPKGSRLPGADDPYAPPGGGVYNPPPYEPPVGGNGGPYEPAPLRPLRPMPARTTYQMGRKRRLRRRVGRAIPTIPGSMMQPQLQTGAGPLTDLRGGGGMQALSATQTGPLSFEAAPSDGPTTAPQSYGSSLPAAPPGPAWMDEGYDISGLPGYMQRAIRKARDRMKAAGGSGPGNHPADDFDPYKPGDYLDDLGPIDDLLDPGGNPRLYESLYNEGITQAGDAQRAAVNRAKFYGMDDGLPYGVLAMQAERDSLGQTSRNIASARTQSIRENADRRFDLATGHLGFLRELLQGKISAEDAYRLQQLIGEMQRRAAKAGKGGGTIGVGPISIGF